MLATLIAAATLVGMTPYQKAALLVVSGLPAPRGVGGVIVRRWNRDLPRPPGALVFADQEGGAVRVYPDLPPSENAAAFPDRASGFAAGRDTGRALRRVGVDVDLAPVLDLPDGPLGARQFRSPFIGVAFARGLAAAGVGACAKHFPGLGPLPISTDERVYVRGRLREADLAPYRAAVEARVSCVMVGHGVYPNVGPRRAILEPRVYLLLRRLGFEGVAITDSLDVVESRAVVWADAAVRAGADLLLYTNGADAARAIEALEPLARDGELDVHVLRVLRFQSLLTD